ncbi:MAG: rhomboid family intramembrane serine protease [Candidatus Electrothrix sp. GM3_4]|nr:rhomboid family intramembrane serine protease [Candidatus Electrothrix sp. GM3_4]
MDEVVMSNNVELHSTDYEQTETTPERHEIPWITYAVIFFCTSLWAYLKFAENFLYYKEVVSVVTPGEFRIWTGAVWGLVTAAFVHFGFWHILFNMWWAKDFGRILEPSMGRKKYLLFILSAAIVSAGAQLLLSDQTGVGFSGVVYAMFGLSVVARRVHPEYLKIVDATTIKWLLGWLVLCIVLTSTGTWNVANAAHVAGFVFGLCVGMIFVVRAYVRASSVALLLLAAMAVLSVTYMPWSDAWQSRNAFLQLVTMEGLAEAGDPEVQLLYGVTLMKNGDRRATGVSWIKRSADQDHLPAMNTLAWILATDPDPAIRNADEAVKMAFRACEKDGWKSSRYLNTLAIAYAEVDKDKGKGKGKKGVVPQQQAAEQQAVETQANEDDSIKDAVQEDEKTRE